MLLLFVFHFFSHCVSVERTIHWSCLPLPALTLYRCRSRCFWFGLLHFIVPMCVCRLLHYYYRIDLKSISHVETHYVDSVSILSLSHSAKKNFAVVVDFIRCCCCYFCRINVFCTLRSNEESSKYICHKQCYPNKDKHILTDIGWITLLNYHKFIQQNKYRRELLLLLLSVACVWKYENPLGTFIFEWDTLYSHI